MGGRFGALYARLASDSGSSGKGTGTGSGGQEPKPPEKDDDTSAAVPSTSETATEVTPIIGDTDRLSRDSSPERAVTKRTGRSRAVSFISTLPEDEDENEEEEEDVDAEESSESCDRTPAPLPKSRSLLPTSGGHINPNQYRLPPAIKGHSVGSSLSRAGEETAGSGEMGEGSGVVGEGRGEVADGSGEVAEGSGTETQLPGTPQMTASMRQKRTLRGALKRTTSSDTLSGAFGASFAKVLRPPGLRNQTLQITCMAVAENGALIVTGGTLLRPGRQDPSVRSSSGFINVWRRSHAPGDYGQWHCLDFETDDVLPPVTCLCMKGDLLVTGHFGTEESMKSNLRANTGVRMGQITSFNQNGVMPLGATGSDICVWDMLRDGSEMGMRARESNRKNAVTAVAILTPLDPSEPPMLASVSDGSVTIWGGLEPENIFLEHVCVTKAHGDKVSSLSFLSRSYPNGGGKLNLIATASNDKTVIIWEMLPRALKMKHKLVHAREVYMAEFFRTNDVADESRYIVTASHDQKVRLWHVESGICVHELSAHSHPVLSVDYHRLGAMAASGCQGGVVALIDTNTGLCMRTMRGHTDAVTSVKFVPKHNLLASCSLDGSLRIWEVKSSNLAIMKLGERSLLLSGEPGHGKTVYSVAISADSETLATASRDHTIKLWNTCSGRLRHTLGGDYAEGHTNFVFKVAIHPTERICASASHDGSIRVWAMSNGKCMQVLSQADAGEQEAEMLHSAECSAVAFHPGGEMMASGSYDQSVVIYTRAIYNEDKPKAWRRWFPQMVLAEHKERIWDLTFSGDGNWLATAAWDGTVHLHPLDSLHGKLDPPPTEDAQGAPVTGYLESMQSMQKYEVLNCFSNVWSVAFQPISHLRHTEPLLLTGAADHKIRVWRIEMDSVWRNVQVLEGHSNTVTSTAWHPDGLMFVSSSFDRSVRLWRLSTSTNSDGEPVFKSHGIWSAYSWPTMNLLWAFQPSRSSGINDKSTLMSVATMDGSTFLMDASEAGQDFITFARAQHILKQGAGPNRDAVLDMVKDFPLSLTSLGATSGVLIHSVIHDCDDHRLVKKMLELHRMSGITPMLPYGPHGRPLLSTINSYHNVAAVVDCVIEMGKEGAAMTSAAISTESGTTMILRLIEQFPDLACRLLGQIGMVRANDVVYELGWNQRREMSDDGVETHDCSNAEVGATKYPKRIWGAEKKVASLSGLLQRLLPESGSPSLTDVIAVHASCPFILGLPPSARDGGNDVESIASDLCVGDDDFDDEDDEDEGGGEGRSALERSFLHLAYNSNEPGLFETSLGRAILNFKWEAYGKRVLLTQATVFAFQLASVVFQAYALGRLQHGGGWLVDRDERAAWELRMKIASGLVLGFSFLQSMYEVLQIRAEGLAMYLGDLWSVLDVWVLLLGLLTGVLGMTSTHVTPAVSSVAVFFSWLKVFYFLRAFTTTGSLVRMVVQIGYDMRYLLVLLIVVMFAAASAFFVLMPMHYAPGESDSCDLVEWREALDAGDAAEMAALNCVPPLSYWDTILQAFAIMLGAFDITAFDSLLEYRVLGQGLFIVYAVFQMVLLLNLLIALMGDSYEKVQEKAKTEALRERAGLLVEIELVAGQRYLQRNHFCPRWLHALVPKETLQMGEVNNRTREWAGITGTIRQDLDVYLANLRLQIREEMENNNDAMVIAMTAQMGELLKGMQRDLIAANRQAALPGLGGRGNLIRRRESMVRRFDS